MTSYPKKFFLVVVILLFSSGCAGLSFRMSDVLFEDPVVKLGITPVAPVQEEEAGVLLRVLPPAGGVRKTREESKIFARIKDGQGLEMNFVQNRQDLYEPGTRQDSNMIRSTAEFENVKGKIVEEVEMTTRGEILQFLEGSHESKFGTFDILSWTRTPVFPQEKVKIGDTWTYEEVMDVRLKSHFVKRDESAPYVIRATSILTGFAQVLGKRCAVIETKAFQSKTEHLKILFREAALDIYSDIREWTYLEYDTGTIVARVTTTESRTTSPDAPITDFGQSQSISYDVGLAGI